MRGDVVNDPWKTIGLAKFLSNFRGLSFIEFNCYAHLAKLSWSLMF